MKTFRTLALTLIGLSTFALAGCTEEAATIGAEESSIVGGAAYDAMPAVGSIMEDGAQSCTGTLVTKRLVVTAAHCFERHPELNALQFVIGPNAYAPEQRIAVESFRIHPLFNTKNLTSDIATMTLAEDAPVEPVRFAPEMDESWVGQSLLFVGYGFDDGPKQSGESIKRSVSMPISAVTQTTFRYGDAEKNTCYGDSGGPAFYQDASGEYLLAGVTSWGDPDCTKFGVDTRVDAFRDFIGAPSASWADAGPAPMPSSDGGPASPPDGGPVPTPRLDAGPASPSSNDAGSR